MDVSGISRLANYGDDSREDLSLGKDRRQQQRVLLPVGSISRPHLHVFSPSLVGSIRSSYIVKPS